MKHYSFIEESFSLLSIQVNDSKNNKIAKIMIFSNDGDNEPHMHINSTNMGGKLVFILEHQKSTMSMMAGKIILKMAKRKRYSMKF